MRMNKLAFTRRFTFAVLSLLITANLWGQAALSGSGTPSDPYLITSAEDWNIFANEANAATYWASGVYVQLDANISVTNMVGTSDHKYSGTFDGNWHTMILSLSSTSDDAAPFSIVDGANFKNLVLEGNITTNKKYAGSLIGRAYSNNVTITNCISKVSITTNTAGDGTHGGFVGELSTNSAKMYFNNCIFEGSITGANTGKVAGFIGYSGGHSYITDCIMAGIISVKENTATFVRTRNSGNQHLTRAYYTTKYNYGVDYGPEGTEAYTNASHEDLNNKIYRQYNDTHFIPSADIAGLEQTVYQYTGSNITITPVVKFYGWTLTPGTDYTVSIEKKNGSGVYVTASDIKDAGDYHYIISGVMNSDGDGYGGSHVTEIKVIQLNSWAALVEAMSSSNGTFDLTQNIIAENPRTTDTALVVTGIITLNLNGNTINRNLIDSIVKGQVIRINSGGKLTINGSGAITGGFNYAQDGYIDGGGIYNMGSLILNDVEIYGNKCVMAVYGSTESEARGGGVYSGNGSSLVINDGEIYGNRANGGGGGVYGDCASQFIMQNVYLESNISESKGGGIRVKTTGGATAIIDYCELSFNFTTEKKKDRASKGGGIYMEGGNLEMHNCSIYGNQSTMMGSGFYQDSGTTHAYDCEIYGNGSYWISDQNMGGGIYLSSGTYVMNGGNIMGNNSMRDGGGIYVKQGAHFQVEGNVQIQDNLLAGLEIEEPSANNAYLNGSSVIKVVGPLGEDAIINITPSGSGAHTYVVFAEGVSSEGSLQHFAVDDNGYNAIIDEDGNIEVYEPYAWNNTATWNGSIAENSSGTGIVPTEDSDLEIHRSIKIPSNWEAYAKSISIDDYCNIILEDGAQLLTNSSGVAVLAKKEIKAATTKNDATGWYLISSPAANPNIVSATNLITTGSQKYDLYRYNEAADLQWENYRAGHADFTTLENGRGYLYRNKNDYTINVGGTLHVSDVSCDLSYHATTSPSGNVNTLIGFNIIGNPYSHTIYKGVETEDVHPAIPNGTLLEGKYYVLDAETGKWALTDDGTAIPPMTGILVQAKSAGTLTMKNSTEGEVVPESKNSRANGADRKNIWFTVANSNYEDRTCVEFREGHGLNKIAHENENIQMLYIHHNGEDFASVDMNPEAKMFNLNFEAKTMGYYTLSVEPQGEYSYLHLIDKVTEKEIDLLEENEYTFIGSTSDAANRFIVRMSLAEDPEESDNEVFAYQSGDEIVVTGEGELQVFDVMGRFVATYNVSGVQTVTKPITAGVYIVKLNEKTQKIIIK